ncbi:MAG: MATE family efflux transporter [Candidatus Marinimicrobia bacterium]|nr:MATE family efflux transporter [Candidatus Neomarinimicrobiota bacterium]MBL7022477.1 MATE family efflux transporter [Candidatus Neomarinimicrobiota bacterium]MBL7108668.1 MATE family efflux transporter [Candidatus Neomarinimicrobiota bacterium]
MENLPNKPQKESRLRRFTKNPRKAVWELALPMMFGMAVQNIYNLVDMFFVGKIDANGSAIAALSFNMPFLFFSWGLIFGLGAGVTSVISRLIGEHDKKGADNAAEHTILLGLIMSALITTIGIVFGENILIAMGTPAHILKDAYDYFSIVAGGMVFMIMAIFFRSILSGEGDAKFPMVVMIIGTITNIILDPIFIFYFNMGVKGAAIATVTSQALVTSIFIFALLIKDHAYLSFSLRDFSFRFSILKKIFIVGIPASLSMVIMSVGSGIFNKILVVYSEDAVSGHQIVGRLEHLIFIPLSSIAGALVTLVGMFYGAKNFSAIRNVIFYGMKRSIGIASLIAISFWIFAPFLIQIFTESENIIRYGIQKLKITAWTYPFIAMGMTSSRVMQGLGKGVPMMVTTLLRVLIISVPLSLYFKFVLDKPIEYIWYSIIFSTVISTNVALQWLKRTLKFL